ncbi:extracellular solute-binding protein [Ideonella sp.]|uniref:extracellular solute-binding protein n=1 Tax=Ideonella sp. TaxID=1929293 RepID=UPI002B494A40|nr:extracellular solute-binding protein [Ideonella sp.]HJV67535.1 extracellular solute-binding protein [Ideonella sp.]
MPCSAATRWVRAALLLALVAVASAATAAPKTITVWTRVAFNSLEADAVKRSVAAFNRSQTAYRVELFSSNYRSYADWVQSSAGTGTLPCLLEIDGPFLAEFAWPGYLQPMDRFVSAELRRDLLPSIVAQGTYDGHLYSLGQFDSGLGLWANRRYLRAAGVRIPTVARPWTLAEFEQAMDKLARVPGVDYPLNLALYTGASEFFAYAYLPILAGFGGDFIDRGTHLKARGVLDGPASVAAMRRLQMWLGKGWTQAVRDRNDDFEKRRTALLWTGHWKYASLHEALGDDLVLLPLPDLGHGLKTGMGSWSWSITSACPDPAGAWAFLSHLMSVDEILRMTNSNGAVPARRSALARSALYGPRAPLQVFAQQLFSGAGVPRPVTPGYSTISKSFATAVSAILDGADAQAELTRAAQAIDDDIAANRGYPR